MISSIKLKKHKYVLTLYFKYVKLYILWILF